MKLRIAHYFVGSGKGSIYHVAMDNLFSDVQADPSKLVVIGAAYLLLIGTGLLIDILLTIKYSIKPVNRKRLTERLTGRSWDTFSVGLLLVLFLTVFLFLQLIGLFFGTGEIVMGALFQTGLLYSVSLLFICLRTRRKEQTWESAYGLSARLAPKNLVRSPVYYLAALPPLFFLTFIYQTILRKAGVEIDIQEVAKLFTQTHSLPAKAALVGLAVVAAPFFEELVFRGILFPFLARRIGLSGSIMAVSTLFAVMHFHVPMAAPLFVLSVAFCLAYWRTGSLWVCIGMHALFNGISILALTVLM
ncbi:MAG: CPBP family intramembrane metalloprotease [Kiritimatiellales bacterium]|nr:CPBP family intramembrane metalloprotease [Kiritimatiellales bacterium]